MLIVGGLALGWVSLVLVAPWLPVPAAGLVYLFGSRICHQIAERSLYLDGAQLPVCARCLGIYMGGALAAIASIPFASLRVDRRWLIAAALPTLVTVVGEWLALWQPSNTVRAIAGALLGIAAALALREALGPGHLRSVQ